MYAIYCSKGSEKGSYLSIDRGSGYPYWGTLGMSSIKRFNSVEDAIKYIKSDSMFTRIMKYSDGSSRPPYMLSTAAKLSNDNRKCEIEIDVVKIEPVPQEIVFYGIVGDKATEDDVLIDATINNIGEFHN